MLACIALEAACITYRTSLELKCSPKDEPYSFWDFDPLALMLPCLQYMQVQVVEEACTTYLTSLDFSAKELQPLILLFHSIDNKPALHKTLSRLIALPWLSDVPAVIAAVFKHLLQPGSGAAELCKEVLQTKPAGAICYLQVGYEYHPLQQFVPLLVYRSL